MPRKKSESTPKKLIHKSRGVGSRKKPPVNQAPSTPPTDTPDTAKVPVVAAPSISSSNGAKQPSNTIVAPIQRAKAYTGLSQIPHGLKLPTFDPNTYFTPDLFADSSSLPRISKESADELIQSIEEKRHSIRIVSANLTLNQDLIRAGNEKQKLEGLAIDYATTGINNESKFVNYQTAEVNRDIAENRFDQAQERLTQGKATLVGMQSITPLITDEWEQRKSLKLSQISSLKIEATKAKEALEPKLLQLSESFRQELDDVG